ncbi:MAG: phosphoribosylglycinamide formyltransferase [Burkholderiales bacterium]
MAVVVVISGRGSNLQALLDADIPVAAVVSNVAGAGGLMIAERRGIPTATVPHKDYATREAFEDVLMRAIDAYSPTLVAHAGFMRIVTAGYVRHYAGRSLNIHPSLLPSFTGLHTHERALAAGVKLHGCSVHFVTEELDGGPIVAQAAVPVLPGDTAKSLAGRVLKQEHFLYPRAVRWFLDGKLELDNGRVFQRDRDAQFVFSDQP